MDDNKSKQERLFLQARELCRDNIEDELRLVGAKALDMSQYTILGDETYTLDYIPRIDMSTPSGNINSSEFMERYYKNHRQTGRVTVYNNIVYMYLHEASEHYLTNTEPFMSIDEYCMLLTDTINRLYGVDIVEGIRKYNRNLPVQNKFIYHVSNNVYLILKNGKLYPTDFIINLVTKQHNKSLFSFIYRYIDSVNELQNIKQLRKKIKIKIKRIKCGRH